MNIPFKTCYLLRYISFEITISQSFEYGEPILLAEIDTPSPLAGQDLSLEVETDLATNFFLDEWL